MVALLGYQLVVVSCTTTSDNARTIKQKGFEALHRAWQLGGQGSKIIVLGLQKPDDAKKAYEDIKIDLGGDPRDPMQVWGVEQLGFGVDSKAKLTANFRDYLNKLGWKKSCPA